MSRDWQQVKNRDDWRKNPPTYVGQERKSNGRALSPARGCERCGTPFWPNRGQQRFCETCKTICPVCGGQKSTVESEYCMECRKKQWVTEKRRDQLRRIHRNMFGDNNPAKKPGVGAKISAAISGDKHPAKKSENRAKYAAHADRVRPQKVSKLEDRVAVYLPGWERQHRVRWYRLNFALPDKQIALEVQGCWYHACQQCFPGSPNSETQRLVAANDKRKRKYLKRKGWTVIYLWEHEFELMQNESELRRFIKERLKNVHD